MSGTLFSSKQHRSSRHLRKLSISSPLHITPPTEPQSVFPTTRPPAWTVILIAKYRFEASAKPEMSLQKGDHVRLLERPGNGWLKVQRIHEIGEGLVPASYLEISVNDPQNPVSSEWLNDFQEQASRRNRVSSIKVKAAYLSPCNNYWYRMDVTFNSGRTSCCAMFYEDFVSLHQLLISDGPAGVMTPELPKKQQAVSPGLRNTMRGEAVARSQTPMVSALDKYMQNVLRLVQCHSSNLLGEYIDDHCTRKVHVKHDELFPTDEAVADSLVEGSFRATSGQVPTRNNSFSPTAPLPPIMGSPSFKFESVSYKPNSPYMASNLKYSSYLNQSQASLSHQSSTRSARDVSRLASRNRVVSLNSVIDSYADVSSENDDDDDDNENKDANDDDEDDDSVYDDDEDDTNDIETRSRGDIRDVLEVFQSDFGRLMSRTTSKNSSAPSSFKERDTFSAQFTGMKTPLKTFSSDFGSECNMSSMTTSTSSYEPRTPTLSHPQVHPSVKVLSGFDLSPLEPKKHHEFFSSSGDELSLGTKFSWDPLPHI